MMSAAEPKEHARFISFQDTSRYKALYEACGFPTVVSGAIKADAQDASYRKFNKCGNLLAQK